MTARQFCLLILALATAPVAAAQQPTLDPSQVARIDSIFARYNRADAPGCVAGVSRRDTIVFEKAWGSAHLEHGVPLTPGSVIEAGSVSKQFTTAAVIRLAQQKKLSLDDDVRKHVPELREYGKPITIRHLINHTSGLRDWGALMAFAGWPRGTRMYTHAHVLDILSRQRGLNYPVGDEYLYSNSNYNLLAIIAERVSGQSLADFTRKELFEPLGMTKTGWRDDFTRIVPGRAQAYSPSGQTWRLTMPNENVYGNSSLLTTVGDLLRWSANIEHKRVGGDEFVAEMLRPGRLNAGREIPYAGGVMITEFAGTREIFHDGATAGYRAFLARYPDADFSVALLCNAGSVNPVEIGHRLASVVLPTPPRTSTVTPARDTVGLAVPGARLAPLAGYYRSILNDEPLHLTVSGNRLRRADGLGLVATSDRRFVTPSGRTHLQFDMDQRSTVRRIRVTLDGQDTVDFVPVGAGVSGAGLRDYEGAYYSDEVEAGVTVSAADTALVIFLRPDTRMTATPIYEDGFTAFGTTFRFTRDSRGRVDGFLATSGRARNVRYERGATPR